MWLCARARECWSWDALHRAFEFREAYHSAGARAAAVALIARGYDAVADVHRRDDPPAHATTADLVTRVRRAVAELPHIALGQLKIYHVVFPRHLPPFCRAWPAYSGPWPCLAVVPNSAQQ
jgi:hypothetical protein